MSRQQSFSHYFLRRRICDAPTLQAAESGDRVAQLVIWRSLGNNDKAWDMFIDHFGIDPNDLDIFGEPNLA
jgi:hypothetical protein